MDSVGANSIGAKCFSKVWLNFISLLQSKIWSQIQVKTNKKKRRSCHVLVLSQYGILNF